MKRFKLYIIIGVVLLIIAILFKTCSGRATIKVYTDVVAYRSVLETVNASGKIQPETEIKISSDVSGEITEMYVKEGQHVKKGDLLCRIKPDNYESLLQRAQASVKSTQAGLKSTLALLDQSKASFENARLIYERQKSLFENKLIAQQDFEAALTQYKSAEANVKSIESNVLSATYGIEGNEAALKEARNNLEKTFIYAPADATISKLSVEQGERVVGVSGMSGTELMRLANLNEMEVSVEINEIDIVKIHLKDSAIVDVEAYPNERIRGIVTEIANSSQNTSSLEQVTNFVVKVRLIQESYRHLSAAQEQSPFRPGMSASVSIMTRFKSKCLSVPIQAVISRNWNADTIKKQIQKSTESNLGVFIISNNKPVLKPVKTGIQDAQFIELTAGLKAGETIIAGPFDALNETLKPQSEIEIVEKDAFLNPSEKP